MTRFSILGLTGAGLAVPLIVLGTMLAVSRPVPPPPLTHFTDRDAIFAGYFREAPAMSTFAARNGSQLAYRKYPGQPGKGIAVVVHGSSGSSLAMHGVAKTLQTRGIGVYAIDLRGHGDSGPLGDVDYRGQLADDLEDLVAVIAKDFPAEKRTLIGHSLGGAFILKVAASPKAALFDRYLALSPFMGASTPMNRPDSGGWSDAAIPRFVALAILDRFGVRAFDHLPVVAYAVPANAKGKRTVTNSYALFKSATLERDWQTDVRRIQRPTTILIGERDELFAAAAYPETIGPVNPGIRIEILPGVGHLDMVTEAAPMERAADLAR